MFADANCRLTLPSAGLSAGRSTAPFSQDLLGRVSLFDLDRHPGTLVVKIAI